MTYLDECKRAMTWLGKQKNTFFMGQTVKYPGSPMFGSLEKVPEKKKLELPLIEDDQMGMSIGMSMNGMIPISIYPRIDFLICAINQLVNHLDKIDKMSEGEFKPGVIIRTQVGNTEPIWPGLQHCGDYRLGLDCMLKNIKAIKIYDAEDVLPAYKKAYKNAKKGISVILVEMPQGGSENNFHKVKTEGKK